MFFGYYFNTILNDSCLSNVATFQAVNQIVTGSYGNATQGISGFNQNLLFGDFINTWIILKNIMTGQTFNAAFGIGGVGSTNGVLSCAGWGGFDGTLSLLIAATFYLSVTFLLIYMISFRSV